MTISSASLVVFVEVTDYITLDNENQST